MNASITTRGSLIVFDLDSKCPTTDFGIEYSNETHPCEDFLKPSSGKFVFVLF